MQVTVRGEAGTVVLGGMSTRALTEPRARYLMEGELDQIWAWAASWNLVPAEAPGGQRDSWGRGTRPISSLRGSMHLLVGSYDGAHGNENEASSPESS